MKGKHDMSNTNNNGEESSKKGFWDRLPKYKKNYDDTNSSLLSFLFSVVIIMLLITSMLYIVTLRSEIIDNKIVYTISTEDYSGTLFCNKSSFSYTDHTVNFIGGHYLEYPSKIIIHSMRYINYSKPLNILFMSGGQLQNYIEHLDRGSAKFQFYNATRNPEGLQDVHLTIYLTSTYYFLFDGLNKEDLFSAWVEYDYTVIERIETEIDLSDASILIFGGMVLGLAIITTIALGIHQYRKSKKEVHIAKLRIPEEDLENKLQLRHTERKEQPSVFKREKKDE